MTENALAHTDIDAKIWNLGNDISRENNLRGDRKAFGEKLIRIRALLEQKNGCQRGGKTGGDGLNPKGWADWCRNNGISRNVAINSIREAVGNPKPRSQVKYSATRLLQRMKHTWNQYTDAEKAKFAAFIRERALEERTNVMG